jgi:hypothetical protein
MIVVVVTIATPVASMVVVLVAITMLVMMGAIDHLLSVHVVHDRLAVDALYDHGLALIDPVHPDSISLAVVRGRDGRTGGRP